MRWSNSVAVCESASNLGYWCIEEKKSHRFQEFKVRFRNGDKAATLDRKDEMTVEDTPFLRTD